MTDPLNVGHLYDEFLDKFVGREFRGARYHVEVFCRFWRKTHTDKEMSKRNKM